MAKVTCSTCGWGLGARDDCPECMAARKPQKPLESQYWRPSRDQTYMEICHVLRKRSTCLRGKVGAILVRDRRIVATGYNGAPPGLPHCFELGCNASGNEHVEGCTRAVHAEANVVSFAARTGQRSEGATLYCTHGPCLKCAQLIICAGIERVIYETPYRLDDGLKLLDQASIPTKQFFWDPEPQEVT
jgi:dCMP deaminase